MKGETIRPKRDVKTASKTSYLPCGNSGSKNQSVDCIYVKTRQYSYIMDHRTFSNFPKIKTLFQSEWRRVRQWISNFSMFLSHMFYILRISNLFLHSHLVEEKGCKMIMRLYSHCFWQHALCTEYGHLCPDQMLIVIIIYMYVATMPFSSVKIYCCHLPYLHV